MGNLEAAAKAPSEPVQGRLGLGRGETQEGQTSLYGLPRRLCEGRRGARPLAGFGDGEGSGSDLGGPHGPPGEVVKEAALQEAA